MANQNARVASLWRYPVSSMAGEQVERAVLGAAGLVGDRIWGVFNRASERIAWPGRDAASSRVPRGYARLGESGALQFSVDGRSWRAPVDDGTDVEVSGLFGFPAELKPFEGDFRPRYTRAPIHLLTTASLRTLRQILPDSRLDERRFRPNMLVDIADGAEPIPENAWIGRDIRIGDVVLRGTLPCARCGFTTLELDGLPLDVEVLRTITKRFGRNFGIYCDVVTAGEVHRGDAVTVGSQSSG
jgi:uncharacterized protein